MHDGGERRVQGAAALLLVLLLAVVPLAHAAAIASFTTGSSVHLPDATTFRLEPAAVYIGGTDEFLSLELVMPLVHVDVRTSTATELLVGDNVVDGPARVSVRSYDLHDAVLQIVPGSIDGFLGIYPHPGSDAEVVSEGAATLAPETALRVGGLFSNQGSDGDPANPDYGRTFSGPVLDLHAGGTLTYTGPGVVKLNGPAVLVSARENVTRMETGRRFSSDAAVREVNETWAVLTFDDATLTARHPRMQLAADSAGLTWSGAATVGDMDGQVTSDGDTYVGHGERVTLDGDFDGVATSESSGGRAVAAVQVEGVLASTSLAPASRAVTPAPEWRPVGLGILLGATVMGAGLSGALLYRRRARRAVPDLTVEQCRDLADAAMENLRFADALEWLEKAQALAPASARLWMDKGYCHASLGDVPEALAAYDRASDLSSDGEADLLAASLLLRAGAPDHDAAERHVERALARSPAMALEVQLDNVFDPLRRRPRFARAMGRALGERRSG